MMQKGKRLSAAQKRLKAEYDNRQQNRLMAMLFVVFTLACTISIIYLRSSIGDKVTADIAVSGGKVGPIEVKRNNSTYRVKIKQSVGLNQWSLVTCALLDANEDELMTFGDEFWSEDGRDDEGYWQESKSTYRMDITIPKKGTYYFELETESDYRNSLSNMVVSIEQKRGSRVYMILGAIFGIIFALYYNEKANNTLVTIIENMSED